MILLLVIRRSCDMKCTSVIASFLKVLITNFTIGNTEIIMRLKLPINIDGNIINHYKTDET